ncbi:MAG: DUF2309 domain-containing protein [Haliscomenobacter sp.]|nr:DUF2309 domain-containing protein [Haliscomenobacter sp.]
MMSHATDLSSKFDEHHVLHEIKHYLPAQAPLKDFVHHNTLHAYQHLNFTEGTQKAATIFGYKVSLSLVEFRELYQQGRINPQIIDKVIIERKGEEQHAEWLQKLLHQNYRKKSSPRIGALRGKWKVLYNLDMDSLVHPLLFRILCSFLDQGIAMWPFPVNEKSFLSAIRRMERHSDVSLFRRKRAKALLLDTKCEIADLLHILIGDESLYEQYLFDQQFAHQGWSGMIATVEAHPYTLLDERKLSLHDLIVFELLLEIDTLDFVMGENWQAMGQKFTERPQALFDKIPYSERTEVLSIWQEAFEWNYYDQVLAGIKHEKNVPEKRRTKNFQAAFCIDDREGSLRRYLELFDPECETFGTPGFFGVEFYFQPQGGKFLTKTCPAPMHPKFLIREEESSSRLEFDLHLLKQSYSSIGGWFISQTLGFWAGLRLFLNIFRPSMGPATASSLKHMDKYSKLTIECGEHPEKVNGLQVGYSIDEMVTRVETVLRSIGLIKDFAPLVYIVGHGASSVNNPYYAAYDCGACSGRAGSVNARVFSYMANHPEVRSKLAEKGLLIPVETQFVGALHDTTRDEIVFYDEFSLPPAHFELHTKNEVVFEKALDYNAKERSRRFYTVDTHKAPIKVHEKVLSRSVSLFEPRPELNHATNALCIIGGRNLSRGLFLDRRAFLNSYDYRQDPEGIYLSTILDAAAPVCGGINLEYFFSRVDEQKLGAGSKLPHNVMGLFGVANGIDGDLRPGLPTQMTEVHDPLRLLMIVEHHPELVLKSLLRSAATYEWFINEWINLIVVHPETREFYRFKDGTYTLYEPLQQDVPLVSNLNALIETHTENLPVHLIPQN